MTAPKDCTERLYHKRSYKALIDVSRELMRHRSRAEAQLKEYERQMVWVALKVGEAISNAVKQEERAEVTITKLRELVESICWQEECIEVYSWQSSLDLAGETNEDALEEADKLCDCADEAYTAALEAAIDFVDTKIERAALYK